MSNYNYNPEPPRVWSRVQSQQTYINENFPFQYDVYVPLIDETIPQEDADFLTKQINKGNILQYKANSARLTKSQKYSQLARGMGPSRKKVFATQSETYTNPNTTGLLRKDYITYNQNDIVGAPKNPDNCPDNLIKDGGTLVAGIYANPCTGEIYKEDEVNANLFNPSSASDVPGQDQLYWNSKLQPWIPRQRYTMTNSSNKWPINYKGLKSAITPNIIPPIIRFSLIQNNSINLNWKIDYLYKMDSFNIYVNGIFIKNIPNNGSYSYSLSIQETDSVINSNTTLPEDEQTKNLAEPNLLKLLVLKSSDLDTLKSFVSKATDFNIPTNLYYINFTSILNKTESPFSNTLQIDTTPYKVADISNNIPDPSANTCNNPCHNTCFNTCFNCCHNSCNCSNSSGTINNVNTDNKLNQIISMMSNLNNSIDNIENDVTIIKDNNNTGLLNSINQKVQEISVVSNKIDALQLSIDDVSCNPSGLIAKIDSINQKIDTNTKLVGDIKFYFQDFSAGMTTEIFDINNKLDAINTNISNISDIPDLTTTLNAINMKLDTNNNLISNVKDNVLSIESEIKTINSTLTTNNNLINNMNSNVNNMNSNINNMNSNINNVNSNINNVNSNINNVNSNILSLASEIENIDVKLDSNNDLITNVNNNVNLLRDEINQKLNIINSLSIDILSKTTSILDKVKRCGCCDSSSNPAGCNCDFYNSLFTNDTISTINSYVLQYISTAFDDTAPDILITIEQFDSLNIGLQSLEELILSESPECCFRNIIDIYRNILKIIKYGFDDRYAKKSALLAAEAWKQDSIILRDKEKLQEYLENLNKNFTAMSFQITSAKVNIKIQYQVYHERYGVPYNLEYDPILLKAIMVECGIVY